MSPHTNGRDTMLDCARVHARDMWPHWLFPIYALVVMTMVPERLGLWVWWPAVVPVFFYTSFRGLRPWLRKQMTMWQVVVLWQLVWFGIWVAAVFARIAILNALSAGTPGPMGPH